MKKIIELQIEQRNLCARYYINDFDLFGQDLIGASTIRVPINQYVSELKNHLKIVITLDKKNAYGLCSVKLCECDYTGVNPNDPIEKIVATYDQTLVTEPKQLGFFSEIPNTLLHVNSESEGHATKLDGSFLLNFECFRSARAWEEGEVLTLGNLVFSQDILKEYKKLHSFIMSRDVAKLIDYSNVRLNDYREAFEFPSVNEALQSLRLFDMVESEEWELEEFPDKELKHLLAGHNKVVSLVRSNGKPVIILKNNEAGMSFAVRSSYSYINKRWRLVL